MTSSCCSAATGGKSWFLVCVAVCYSLQATAFLLTRPSVPKQEIHQSSMIPRDVFYRPLSSNSLLPSQPTGVLFSSSSVPTETAPMPQELDAQQLDFTMGYLNKHHGDTLQAFAETFSELGVEQAKRNAWSGGSYTIQAAKMVNINVQQFELEVSIQLRNKKEPTIERVVVNLGRML
jgi:hypothetical protein